MFKLRIAFRNPRKTNFPRTTGVATRVINTSNVRTSRVASLTLTGIRVTKEKPMFKLASAFRNPRKTNFRRTTGVANRVITAFKMHTFFASNAFALIAVYLDMKEPILPERGNSGRSETIAFFFAPSATTKAKPNAKGGKMEFRNVAKGERRKAIGNL
jgi:hypothetical protein